MSDDPEALIAESVKSLEDKVGELGADNIAAFFCEPIVGSGWRVGSSGWMVESNKRYCKVWVFYRW